jgi:hypothetical protein
MLMHVIADAHIYDRQMKGVQLQLSYYNILTAVVSKDEDSAKKIAETIFEEGYEDQKLPESPDALVELAKEVMEVNPEFSINTEETDFFKYDVTSCSLENYKHMGKISFGDIVV